MPPTCWRRYPATRFPSRRFGRSAGSPPYASWLSAPVEPAPVFDDIDGVEVQASGRSRQRRRRRLADRLTRFRRCWRRPASPRSQPKIVDSIEDAARDGRGATRVSSRAERNGTAAAAQDGVARRHHPPGRRTVDGSGRFRRWPGRADVEQVVIQPMIDGGVEMFVGATWDAAFGHLIVCGGGGTTVELLRDTAHRLAPLSATSVRAMLDQIRSTRLLRGFRGGAVLDEPAFRHVILRVSALVEAAPGDSRARPQPRVVTRTGALSSTPGSESPRPPSSASRPASDASAVSDAHGRRPSPAAPSAGRRTVFRRPRTLRAPGAGGILGRAMRRHHHDGAGRRVASNGGQEGEVARIRQAEVEHHSVHRLGASATSRSAVAASGASSTVCPAAVSASATAQRINVSSSTTSTRSRCHRLAAGRSVTCPVTLYPLSAGARLNTSRPGRRAARSTAGSTVRQFSTWLMPGAWAAAASADFALEKRADGAR